MQSIENFLNSLNDQDWGWWPLGFLRPQKHRKLGTWTVLQLTALFGPLSGSVAFLGDRAFAAGEVTVLNMAVHVALASIVFFVLYKVTFAHCWNRRARRLNQGQAGESGLVPGAAWSAS